MLFGSKTWEHEVWQVRITRLSGALSVYTQPGETSFSDSIQFHFLTKFNFFSTQAALFFGPKLGHLCFSICFIFPSFSNILFSNRYWGEGYRDLKTMTHRLGIPMFNPDPMIRLEVPSEGAGGCPGWQVGNSLICP